MVSLRLPRLELVLLTMTIASGLATGKDCWGQSESSPSDFGSPNTTVVADSPAGEPTDDPAEDSIDAGVTVPAPLPPAPLPPAPNTPPTIASANSNGAPAQANAADPTSRRLQAIVREAINDLDASKIPDLESARSRLSESIAKLEKYIAVDSPNGQAWSRFLRLEALKRELAAPRPNLETLLDLQLNMRQNYLGLEYAPYQDLRESIEGLVRAVRYGSQPERTVEQLETKLTQLIESLNEPAPGAATERSFAVGLIANYLHEMDQAPEAVAKIHQQFSAPNFQVYAHEQLLNRLLQRTVAQPSPVNECLLGTHIVGQACLVGGVSVDVLPMTQGVAMQLNLNANVSTRSTGYNRGVVLGSTAYSPVHAAKQVFVTPTGISSLPATVATNLQTSINSIQHRLKLVRRIASRKAAEQKPLADSIAQGRLQNRIRTQYEEQVNEQLAEARGKLSTLQSETRPELGRLGLPKPNLSIYSTDISLHGDVKQAAAFQLAAHTSCSLPKSTAAEIVIETHQSAVVNALDLVLGDRTIRSADLDDYARQALGEVPEDVQKEADGESWSITLATYRPVEIEFDDGKIRFKLRVTRMTRGSQALDDGAFVTAIYRPSYADGVLTFQREGEVEVTFARAQRGLRVVTLRSFLKGKFDMFFKEQIVTQRLDVAQQFPNFPALNVDALAIDDGWLQVGLR